MSESIVYCPNCGAPAVSEICPYCGTKTGIDSLESDMVYPSMEVKEANMNFWSIVFPLIFAFGFGAPAIIFPFIFNGDKTVVLMCLIFGIIGLGAAILVIRTLIISLILTVKGTEVKGTVYGYMNDNVLYNNMPGQKVKILISTSKGKKILLYQLSSPDKPFPINSKIKLKVYKNMCKIYQSDKNCLD